MIKAFTGRMRIPQQFFIFPVFYLAFLILISNPSHIQAKESIYLDTILQTAKEVNLHDHAYWHTLMHYKKDLFGISSLIDDPDFFLACNGKTDPQAELLATIKSFFKESDDNKKYSICRFIARYYWIKEQLDIDPSQLPYPECERFEKILGQINPSSVSLIFPTSHINSPASMFGHTLLTIGTENKSKLLAHAINYAAFTDETFGPLFALKGLFGLYKGYYSILPYYSKLQEYRDVHHRDIWEYSLNLNQLEIRRLLMHIYELDSIFADYYFFDENCSYNLLFLLDAARPSLNLTDQCNWWIIPLDSIRIIKLNNLVIEPAIYRPSKTTKINKISSLLSKKSRKMAMNISKGIMEPDLLKGMECTIEEKRGICDLAVEHIQYQFTKKAISKEYYLDRFLKTLKIRSLFGEADANYYDIEAPPEPLKGHGSNLFSFGIGREHNLSFQEIRYRPAYHGLCDNDKGYKAGSQIIFANIVMRYYSSEKKITLETLDCIDILSLAPRDLFQPISWKIKTGLTRKPTLDGIDHSVFNLNPGGGLCYRNNLIGLFYFMAESDLNISGAFRKDFTAGIGGSIGLLKKPFEFWKLHLYVRDIYYGLGDQHNAVQATLLQNISLNTDMSLTIAISRFKNNDTYSTEAKLYWSIFF